MNAESKTVEEIWRKYDRDEVRLTRSISERMLDLAQISEGQKVIDLATGRGEPAIRAAHRVGQTGKVYGIDTSESMLAMARERAEEEHIGNLILQVLSAENLAGVESESMDGALSRWALMYFAEPRRAMKEVARVLKPSGLFVVAVWGEPETVSYYTFPRRVLAQFKNVPTIDLTSPGPFYYSQHNRLRSDLEQSGFKVETIEAIDTPVMEAESPEELVEWARCFGLQKLLVDLPLALQKGWEREMIRQCARYQHQGKYQLGGTTLLGVARKLVNL